MNNSLKNKILVAVLAGLLLILSLFCWFKPGTKYSEAERRYLTELPKLTLEGVRSGKYMKKFEEAAPDQFPFRDGFRRLKSMAALHLFAQPAVNDYYLQDGYIGKVEYPLSESMLENSAKKFRLIYDTYLAGTDTNLYLSVIPGKHYFLAEDSGTLSLDYDALVQSMREKADYLTYIDLFPLLSIEDYYRTDTHWRQERLVPIAQALAAGMGVQVADTYTENTVDAPFYGVYYGQLAMPALPDTLRYLTSEELEEYIVTSYNSGKPELRQMYELDKTEGRDPYEMFLCGSDALLTIENPNADTDRELVIFRDSYTSSLAPLLASGYRKITLADIRYIHPGMLGSFIEFTDQDVLFLYSTMVLNGSTAFK